MATRGGDKAPWPTDDRRPAAGAGTPALRGLGAREATLAGLVAAGLSDAEIAARLSLPLGEIQPALDTLLGTLHLRSRTELALLAAGRPMDDDRWPPHER